MVRRLQVARKTEQPSGDDEMEPVDRKGHYETKYTVDGKPYQEWVSEEEDK